MLYGGSCNWEYGTGMLYGGSRNALTSGEVQLGVWYAMIRDGMGWYDVVWWLGMSHFGRVAVGTQAQDRIVVREECWRC